MSKVRRVSTSEGGIEFRSYRAERGGFFTFRTMLTPILIRVLYIAGAVLITVGLLAALIIAPRDATVEATLLRLFGTLLGIVVLNVLWRLLCEGIIILFSIHEVLVSIDKQLKRR